MSEHTVVMKMAKPQRISSETIVYQVEDGTIFYWKWTLPQKLFVVNKAGAEVDAKLPGIAYEHPVACGNAVYFIIKEQSEKRNSPFNMPLHPSVTRDKIYAATFSPRAGISVSYLREAEDAHFGALRNASMRVRNGKKHFCRVDEDPTVGGITVDVNDHELAVLQLAGIHRQNVIFISQDSIEAQPSAYKLRDNAIVIKLPDRYGPLLLRDSSPFIFLSCSPRELCILNAQTMEFLPTLHFDEMERIHDLAGVYDGLITMTCNFSGGHFLLKVQLPSECNEHDVSQENINDETGISNFITARRAKVEATTIREVEHVAETKNTVDTDEITSTSIDCEKQPEQTVSQLRATIEEQIEQIKSMQADMAKVELMINDVHEVNTQLQEEAKENEKLKAELSKTIEQLRKENYELIEEKHQVQKEIEELKKRTQREVATAAEINGPQVDVQSLQAGIEKMTAMINDIQMSNFELQKEMRLKEQEKAAMSETIDNLRQRIYELVEERSAMQKNTEEEKQELNGVITELRRELADLAESMDLSVINEKDENEYDTVQQLRDLIDQLNRGSVRMPQREKSVKPRETELHFDLPSPPLHSLATTSNAEPAYPLGTIPPTAAPRTPISARRALEMLEMLDD